MKVIRIGNDIKVMWSIYTEDGSPFSIAGLKLNLYLKTIFGKKEIKDYEVSGNRVIWVFYGKDQSVTGKYSLELVVNDGEEGMITVDTAPFVKLVASCCHSEGEDEDNIQTETVELRSDIDYLSGGGGGSVVVDSFLSETSINPVQNRVITGALNAMAEDSIPLQHQFSDEFNNDFSI